MVRKIVHLRWKQRLGPVAIADRLGMQASTVHAVLVRCRLNRLTHADRATGEPIRRYEHEKPGDLIHVDVKKLGKVPDGGGWRYVARQQGDKNRSATAVRTGGPRNKHHNPLIGTCYLHTVIDDHSRVAYVEAHVDETAATAAAAACATPGLVRQLGVTIQRVLSDNGSAHRSHLWRDTCAQLTITPRRTRPYRPHNGRIERFHRTLAEGGAFKKLYDSESPLAALPAWAATAACCRRVSASAVGRSGVDLEPVAVSRDLRQWRQAARGGRNPVVRVPLHRWSRGLPRLKQVPETIVAKGAFH